MMNAINEFKEYGLIKKYQAGEYIHQSGAKGEEFFVVIRGLVEVRGKSLNNNEGSKEVYQAGEFFGELGLGEGCIRDSNAIAQEPSHILCIPREKLDLFLEDQPLLGKKIITTLANRKAIPITINQPRDPVLLKVWGNFINFWIQQGRNLGEIKAIGFSYMAEAGNYLWIAQTLQGEEKGTIAIK